MGVQAFLKSAFKSCLDTMGAEDIGICGQLVRAVLSETAASNELGRGATDNRRTLTAQFSNDSYTGKLKSGMIVQARGQKWQIASDDGAIRKDQSTTAIVLNEPERREE